MTVFEVHETAGLALIDAQPYSIVKGITDVTEHQNLSASNILYIICLEHPICDIILEGTWW